MAAGGGVGEGRAFSRLEKSLDDRLLSERERMPLILWVAGAGVGAGGGSGRAMGFSETMISSMAVGAPTFFRPVSFWWR